MTDRFSNLTKVPQDPAAKLLALANLDLETKLDAPPSAPVDVVLQELERKEAGLDILRVLASALPVRERVWWSCLAARDIVGPGPENETQCLRAAEAWVFRPTEANREEAVKSMEHVDPKDVTSHCAMGVMYCDDTLGTGELEQYPAPQGVGALVAFAMNMESLVFNKEIWDEHLQVLIDRALNIARGGSGKTSEEQT